MGFKTVSRQTRGVVVLAVVVWAVVFLWKLPGLVARWDSPVQRVQPVVQHGPHVSLQVDAEGLEEFRTDDDTVESKPGACHL